MDGAVDEDIAENIEAEPDLQNKDPAFVTYLFSNGLGYLQSYGWIVIFIILVLLYIKSKLAPTLEKMHQKAEDLSYQKKYDSGTAQKRLEAMEKARRRLQEEHDAKAREYAEQQKIKEEEKRKQKIEEWEKHQEGKGYRSKIKPKEEDTSDNTARSKRKPMLRQNDYNPLMGGGGSGYRPPRRGGGG